MQKADSYRGSLQEPLLAKIPAAGGALRLRSRPAPPLGAKAQRPEPDERGVPSEMLRRNSFSRRFSHVLQQKWKIIFAHKSGGPSPYYCYFALQNSCWWALAHPFLGGFEGWFVGIYCIYNLYSTNIFAHEIVVVGVVFTK